MRELLGVGAATFGGNLLFKDGKLDLRVKGRAGSPQTGSLNGHVYILDKAPERLAVLSAVAKAEGWGVSRWAELEPMAEALHRTNRPALVLVDVCPEAMDLLDLIGGLKRPMRLRFVAKAATPDAIALRMIADARDFEVGRNLFEPLTMAGVRRALREDLGALAGLTSNQPAQAMPVERPGLV